MARKPKHGRERVDNAAERVRSVDAQSLVRRAEYGLFYVVGSLVFIAVFAVLAISAATGSWGVAALASIILFVWAASTIRPYLDSLETFGSWLWSDQSAEWFHDTWNSLLPWRDRRGGTGVRGVLALALAVLLIGSVLTAAVPASATTTSSSSSTSCSEQVIHDWPQTNQSVEEFNNSSSVSKVVSNTRVEIENTDSFYRIKAENPNAYCVRFVVRIHEDIIPPTELGTVESVNGTTTGEWHDVTEYDTQRTYTELEFTLQGGESAMFAPSEPAVLVPAWRDQQKREATGFIASVTSKLDFESPFDDDTEELKTKTMTFSKPDGSDYVTVRLDNRTTNQSVEEWHALARPSGEEDVPWNPISQDSSAPVFYRLVDGGSKMQFVFNDPNVTVRFVANPEAGDELSYEMESLQRSLYELKTKLPLTITVTPPSPDWGLGAAMMPFVAARRTHS